MEVVNTGQAKRCDYRYDPESRCDGVYDADGRCDQCGRPSIFHDYDFDFDAPPVPLCDPPRVPSSQAKP